MFRRHTPIGGRKPWHFGAALLTPPLLCSLAVALGITLLPATADRFWWLEVAVGAALLGGCLLLFERRIAKAAWSLARGAR